jgi:hypothetical protein
MKSLRLAYSFSLLFAVSMVSAQTSVKCDVNALPKSVSETLSSRYADWRIKTVDDLESYDRELWLKNNPHDCPGFTSGHFVGSTDRSFAVLLVSKERDANGYKVVLFSRSDSQPPYVPKVIAESKSQNSASMVIYRVPPGTYSDAEHTRRVQIRLDSFQVEILEASATLYFWQGGRIQHLQTSE